MCSPVNGTAEGSTMSIAQKMSGPSQDFTKLALSSYMLGALLFQKSPSLIFWIYMSNLLKLLQAEIKVLVFMLLKLFTFSTLLFLYLKRKILSLLSRGSLHPQNAYRQQQSDSVRAFSVGLLMAVVPLPPSSRWLESCFCFKEQVGACF